MIQLHYDVFTNFWYHLLAHLDVDEPSAIYNNNYITNSDLVIPDKIKDFFNKNLSIVSHFPFYKDVNNIINIKEIFISYFALFPNKEELKTDIQKISDDFYIFIETEYEKYKNNWQSLVVFDELNAFKTKHIDKFIHALKFFSYLSEMTFTNDLHVWLIKAMPSDRGKSIEFAERIGFAIAVPDKDRMPNDIYFVGVHELAHYFTDKLLSNAGFSLSMNKNNEDYIRRESLADFITEIYFKDIGKPIVAKWEKEFLPQEIIAKLNDKYSKLHSNIEIVHFGDYSREFTTEEFNQTEVIKDIFFIEKRDERIFLFLPLIGRMVGVPVRYFKKLSPMEFDDVYNDQFIKAGLLVPKGHQYLRQSVEALPKVKGFVKKVRFHMTNKCNLRCKYCYLSAGEGKEAEINAEKAISYLDKLYGHDLSGIEVEFHGGGEPTLMINEIKKIVDFIDNKTAKRTFRLQTNGVFATDIVDWIVEKKIIVSVSIDGDKEVNDYQRTEGTEAFRTIENNITELVKRGVSVSTVSIITEYSQDKINRIYEYIKSLGIKAMMFNPVHSFLGRAHEQDHPAKRDVDLMTFVSNFLRVKQKADKEGIYLVSDFLPDLYQYIPRNYQCDACKPGVCVYGNGDICSCTRAYDLGQGASNPFVWANINSEVEVYKVNEAKLTNRVTENMPECKHCLLKWNCAGDCLLQCHELNGDIYKVYKERCNAKIHYAIEYLKGEIKETSSTQVLLLHFPAVTPMLPPPGVNFLANYLLKQGIGCEIIDINKDMYYNYNDNWRKTFSFQDNYLKQKDFQSFIDNYLQKIISIISDKGYTYIGVSCFENTFDFVKKFLELMKPNKTKNILLGGPDVFMEVNKYKEFILSGMADALILKEGEKKVLEYVAGNKQILGVITKDNIDEDFIHYKDNEVISLSSELVLLEKISGFSNGKFIHQVMPICASRGCSSNCSFCSHKMLWDGFRIREVVDVIQEMLFHKREHNCNLFYFTDMLLNGSSSWLKAFVEELITLKDKMYWSAYVRIDSIFDQDFSNKLVEAGAVYLSFGIESNSQRVLDAVNKGTSVEDNEMVIPNIAKAGIFIHASFIIGLPEERVEDLVATLDYIKRNIWNIDHVEIFFFENLPQSSGYVMSKEYLIVKAEGDKYPLKKQLYDELIIEFNRIGAGFLSSRQLYSSEASNFKKALNEFYRKKYTGEQQSGEESFIVVAEKIHKFKMEQIKLLDEYIGRLTV